METYYRHLMVEWARLAISSCSEDQIRSIDYRIWNRLYQTECSSRNPGLADYERNKLEEDCEEIRRDLDTFRSGNHIIATKYLTTHDLKSIMRKQ